MNPNPHILELLNFKRCAEEAPEGAYEDCKRLERLIGGHMDLLMAELREAGYRADNCDRILELEAATYQYVKASNPDATVFPVSEGFGWAVDTEARERVIESARESVALFRSLGKDIRP